MCANKKPEPCKVIHLVRDPRALILSQMKLNFMRRSTLKNGKLQTQDILKHSQRICNRIHHNRLEIKNLSADLLHLYKVLRYEDLDLDLENTTRNLFKFAKIPIKMEISDWIKINTKASSVHTQENLIPHIPHTEMLPLLLITREGNSVATINISLSGIVCL